MQFCVYFWSNPLHNRLCAVSKFAPTIKDIWLQRCGGNVARVHASVFVLWRVLPLLYNLIQNSLDPYPDSHFKQITNHFPWLLWHALKKVKHPEMYTLLSLLSAHKSLITWRRDSGCGPWAPKLTCSTTNIPFIGVGFLQISSSCLKLPC